MLVISTCCLNTWNTQKIQRKKSRGIIFDFFILKYIYKYKSHYVEDKCLDQKSEYFSTSFFLEKLRSKQNGGNIY